jgi:plasmid rolling circle replication initiator protein Rep
MHVTINGIVNVNIYNTHPPQFQPAEYFTEYGAEILCDKINGKVQPWNRKKKKSVMLAHAMREIGEHMNKKANRVWWCSDELTYNGNPNEGGKLIAAGFCRERLCTMCSWRRSIKTFYNLSRVLDVAQDEAPELETVFLTLTAKNANGEDLPAALDTMYQGWRILMNHRRIKKVNLAGWFRALEITYNKNEDTYNQHFHVILLVDKGYFHDPKRYLHTTDWVKLWRASCHLDYDPICHIKAVRTGKDKKRAHVAEVAKYTVKEDDVIQKDASRTVRVVDVLGTALRGRRLFAFGGILKEIAKRLKADKPDEGDLVNIAEETMREDVAQALVTYKWDFGLQDYYRRV